MQFNYIINKFNTTNSFITQPFKQINFLDGGSWLFQKHSKSFILDVNYTRRIAKISALTITNGRAAQSDIKYSASSINLGAGLNGDVDPLNYALGYDFDFGINKISERYEYLENLEKAKFETIQSPLILGGSIWANITYSPKNARWFALMFRPYYHFDFNKTNYWEVNEILNPDTYEADGLKMYSNHNHYGFQIMFVLKLIVD